MMKIESCNQPCPREMPCIGEACLHYESKAYYCDRCKDDTPAVAQWDGEDYCRDCLNEELDKEFAKLSLEEKIEVLGYEDEIEEV